MKFENHTHSDRISNYTIPGVTLTGQLSLSNETDNPGYAVRKEYADLAFTNLSTTTITTGTLPVYTIKGGISGDLVIKTDNTTTLPSIISTGTHTKVTVTSKGVVSLGSTLVESDIPDIAWTKITSGKPTTAGGYGITDALLDTGGTVTGNITLAGDPTTSAHASNKGYVDTIVGLLGSNYIGVGDIIQKLPAPTPTGFLRCNGGYLTKTTYPALYAKLGSGFDHPTINTQFALPDLTTVEVSGYQFFIKT